MDSHSLAMLVAVLVALLTALAEYWHVRRMRTMGRLAFGPVGGPRVWTRSVPGLRVVSCGLLAWGLMILAFLEPDVLASNSGESEQQESADPADTQRVILVLDVSPSMNAEDAGAYQKVRRRDRVMEVVEGVLARIALSRTRFSVVVFFTSARPVVVDATDTNVVRNILDNLPLVWSFEPGETRLLDGLEVAGELAKDWPPASTTMFLCTDGDTVDFNQIPKLPRSIRKVEILAVGDPLVSTRIGGHESRQQAAVLRRLAVEVGGNYHNVNRRHMSTEALADLARVPPPPPAAGLQVKDIARIAIALGAAVLGLLPVLLQYFGCVWHPHRELIAPGSPQKTGDH
ncbi:MAG: Ca-activated chloride channel family protein [Pirellulaceae bacterium]|jgi:Ca-activated chloride channel family protein